MLRRTLAAVLVAVAAVLAPVAVAAVWTKQTVTDQDRYLEVVSSVSEVPQVQKDVRDRVVAAVVERLDVDPLARALVGRAVSEAVDRVITDDWFSAFWLGVNRVVHAQVTGVLAGDSAEFELSEDGTLTMRLGPVVEALTRQLGDRGLSIPSDLLGDRSVVLVRSADLALVQDAYDLAMVAAAWLPLVCVLALCVGLYLVRRRAQALMVAGIVAAAVSVALVVALDVMLGTLDELIAREVAGTFFAALEPWLWTTAAVSAVVALLSGAAAIGRRRPRRA